MAPQNSSPFPSDPSHHKLAPPPILAPPTQITPPSPPSPHPNLGTGLSETPHAPFPWLFPVGIRVSQGNVGSLQQSPSPWRGGALAPNFPPLNSSPWLLTRQGWSGDSGDHISRLFPVIRQQNSVPSPVKNTHSPRSRSGLGPLPQSSHLPVSLGKGKRTSKPSGSSMAVRNRT